MSWHHVQNPEAQALQATIPQPLCLEAQLAATLMSSLLGARTRVIAVVTSSLVSGRTMHDSALHASVVGSNFRLLFHSSPIFPES